MIGRRHLRFINSCVALTAASLLAPASAQPVPGAEWPRTTPKAAGWSADLLAQARDYARGIGTATLLVVQHGRIVDSMGDLSSRLELHSVRKSLLSALIGIAVNEHRLDLNATLAQLGIDDVAPSLTPEEKQATVQDLLESRSGVNHIALYETNGERVNRPSRGSHPHDTFWYYNNWDFNALGTIYEHAAGQPIFEAFQARIARPVGMQDYRPSDGRYVTGPESSLPAYPFHMSARDLARFGLLYLHGGRWGARQVVPDAWVRESTTPRSLTQIGSGYAYLWWTPRRWMPCRSALHRSARPGRSRRGCRLRPCGNRRRRRVCAVSALAPYPWRLLPASAVPTGHVAVRPVRL